MRARAGRSRRWRAWVVAVAVVALIVGVVLLCRSGRPSCVSLGVSSNYQYTGNLPDASHDLPALERDGVTSIREDLLWSAVQPDGPQTWDWSRYDALFTVTARLHINVLPIIDYGTTWASSPNPATSMPETSAGQIAYARFAAAVVERYGPDGTFWSQHHNLTQAPIMAVELWNEPWFSPTATVDAYVSLVRLAGMAVHRVDSAILVAANVDDRRIGDPPSGAGPRWGAGVLDHASELRGVVDRWAIHPYPRGEPTNPSADAIAQVTWLRRLLRRHHLAEPIWVTELGFTTTDARSLQTPADSFASFVHAMAGTPEPNRVDAVWLFTVARPTPDERPGSFDYGFNLVNAAGDVSPSLAAAGRSRCIE